MLARKGSSGERKGAQQPQALASSGWHGKCYLIGWPKTPRRSVLFGLCTSKCKTWPPWLKCSPIFILIFIQIFKYQIVVVARGAGLAWISAKNSYESAACIAVTAVQECAFLLSRKYEQVQDLKKNVDNSVFQDLLCTGLSKAGVGQRQTKKNQIQARPGSGLGWTGVRFTACRRSCAFWLHSSRPGFAGCQPSPWAGR